LKRILSFFHFLRWRGLAGTLICDPRRVASSKSIPEIMAAIQNILHLSGFQRQTADFGAMKLVKANFTYDTCGS
jgi:hypothetical protein